jgi:hypothetical protein
VNIIVLCIVMFSYCYAQDALIEPDRTALDSIKRINQKDINDDKKLVVTFDLNKVNSSTEKSAVRFEGVEDSIAALESQITAIAAQLQALKIHVRETKKIAYELAEVEKKQAALLESRLKDTEEKLAQSQKIVFDQQAQIHKLVSPIESVLTATT